MIAFDAGTGCVKFIVWCASEVGEGWRIWRPHYYFRKLRQCVCVPQSKGTCLACDAQSQAQCKDFLFFSASHLCFLTAKAEQWQPKKSFNKGWRGTRTQKHTSACKISHSEYVSESSLASAVTSIYFYINSYLVKSTPKVHKSKIKVLNVHTGLKKSNINL